MFRSNAAQRAVETSKLIAPKTIAVPITTTGINQIGHSKNSTARMVGHPTMYQFRGEGGAALSDSRLDEWLRVMDRPAEIEPDNDAQSESLVDRPCRCPDS
jgi:hypothetical protein